MKILYVEDNATEADLVQRELQRTAPQFELDIVKTVAQAINALEGPGAASYDLVLTDHHLPDGDGLGLLSHIRQQGLPLAVVFLAGSGDEAVAIAAIKAGADDYLARHSDYLSVLPATLENALERYRKESANREHPLRVLYAERNAIDIDLSRRHLARYAPNIYLEALSTGPELLERLRQEGAANRYDIVLLDYRLAGMTGLEVLKELRQRLHIDLPVVLVTGQGDEEVATQAVRLGAADYLIKRPGYLFQLPSVLENAFHLAQLSREHAALQESESRFRLLAEQAPDVIFRYCLSPSPSFEYISPSVAQVSGYKPEAFYEDPALIRQIVHPEDRSLFDALRDGKLDPEEPLVLRWVRKDGRAIWTEQRNRVTYDEGGKRVALEGIVRDISERRQAEERLHLLSAGLEAAANGIVITDPGGIILWSNPAFTGLTGYHPEDVLGKDLRSLGSGGAMVEFYRQVWQTIQAGEVWHGEVLNYRKDGSTYNEEVTITPVFNNRNEISNFIAVKQDITDRKQDEVERARLYDELARAYDATIEGWSRALDLRDRETEGHTQRVTEMALRLSREMGFSDEALVQVRRGALLHDIGKMGIPDAILHKPGPLNDEEWQIMRRHPVYSYELIYPVEFLRPALDIPYYHHERWNGKGYPRQLKGEQIPLAARIFAAVDVWEALGADRPYRKAWPEQKVLEYLRAEAGEHFDPQVITVFLELLKRK